MDSLNFSGIKGEVIETSPHGNYLVVKLSNRISICGTYSNIFEWEEAKDEASGFLSFLTYIGFNSQQEYDKYLCLVNEYSGYFKQDGDSKRKAKRVKGKFRYEMKVRGLNPDAVIELLNS